MTGRARLTNALFRVLLPSMMARQKTVVSVDLSERERERERESLGRSHELITARCRQGLAERVQPDRDLFLETELADQSCALGTDDARAVRFIHQELRVPVGEYLLCGFDELAQRAYVAVHAVEGLDRYDDAAFPLSDQRLRVADGHHHVAERVDVVVAEGDSGQGLAVQHPVVGARVDQFVVDDGVAGARDRGENGQVGLEAGSHDEARFRAVELRYLILHLLQVRVVAVHDAGAAGAGGDVRVALELARELGAQDPAGAEGEGVVGAEVDGVAVLPEVDLNGVQAVVSPSDIECFFEVAVEDWSALHGRCL